jgi:hypothetical protein
MRKSRSPTGRVRSGGMTGACPSAGGLRNGPQVWPLLVACTGTRKRAAAERQGPCQPGTRPFSGDAAMTMTLPDASGLVGLARKTGDGSPPFNDPSFTTTHRPANFAWGTTVAGGILAWRATWSYRSPARSGSRNGHARPPAARRCNGADQCRFDSRLPGCTGRAETGRQLASYAARGPRYRVVTAESQPSSTLLQKGQTGGPAEQEVHP